MPFKSYHIVTAGVIVISLLFYSRFIPSPKEEWHYILPAIPAAEIRQNMWNCYTFWNMLTIVAFWFHSTNYTGKLLYAFQRKQGRELLSSEPQSMNAVLIFALILNPRGKRKLFNSLLKCARCLFTLTGWKDDMSKVCTHIFQFHRVSGAERLCVGDKVNHLLSA